MKIRNGFVSNSSSSSYLIAFKKSGPCEHCGRSDLDITKFLEVDSEYNEDTSHIRYLGIKDVSDYLKEIYNIGDNQSTLEFARYVKLCALIGDASNDGFDIAYISIPYSDKTTIDILKSSPNIKFLEKDD